MNIPGCISLGPAPYPGKSPSHFAKKHPVSASLLAALLYASSPDVSAFKYKDHQIKGDTVEITLGEPVSEKDLEKLVDYCSRIQARLNGPQTNAVADVYICSARSGRVQKSLVEEAAPWYILPFLPNLPKSIAKVLVLAPKNEHPLQVTDNQIKF